jgi:hypothetical protein
MVGCDVVGRATPTPKLCERARAFAYYPRPFAGPIRPRLGTPGCRAAGTAA